MRFYGTEQISDNISRSPEGFLYLENVPIARSSGSMLYGPDETPIKPGPSGYVKIFRREEDLFSADTLRYIEGKPLVLGHPDEANWPISPRNKELIKGIMLRPRRGEGIQDDLLLVDIVVFDEEMASLILSGVREVSLGYDAKYWETGPGEGYQTDFVTNHLALVEHGRCGIACKIADQQTPGEQEMTLTKKGWIEKLMAAITPKDKIALDKALEDLPCAGFETEATRTRDDAVAMPEIHLHTGGGARGTDDRKWTDAALDEKFGGLEKMVGDNHQAVMDSLEELKNGGKKEEETKDAKVKNEEIEGALKEEAPAGTGDISKVKDSAFLEPSFQETVAMAEIIAPGIGIPTFDAKSTPLAGYTAICKLRANALKFGINDAPTAAIITGVNAGREVTADSLAKMSCSDVRTMFFAVGAIKKQANDATMRGRSSAARPGVLPAIMSTDDINKRNAEFWATQKS